MVNVVIMRGNVRTIRNAGCYHPWVFTRFGLLIVVSLLASWAARAQTPAPLQEWQYSAGIALEKMFEPTIPKWSGELGLSSETRPLYEGSKTYRTLIGPVINVQYFDIAFASVGEGLGVNLLRGENYRAGVALGYDLGRRAEDDLSHLKGLGNISPAPVLKLFGSYVFSKDFPLVLRADARQFLGGADGAVADFSAYLPLPGSSQTLVMFAGPSVTLADRLHLQTLYGINGSQAAASGYRNLQSHGGFESAGFGFSITRIISTRWLLNAEAAGNRLIGSARESPVTQTAGQYVLALSTAYHW
jgi:outer membrane scaffolding protein for murein synthesis (MipA/OmpV family)